MKSNPGGYIAPEQAIGRERTVRWLWETLEVQSVYMNAERRIGKTTVLNLLRSRPEPGFTPVQRDLEGLHTANEFAMAVYHDVDEFLTLRRRAKRRALEFLRKAGGSEIAGVFKLATGEPLSWKVILESSIEDLSESFAAGEGRLLFLWDEVPFMLSNIAKREGEQSAMEVLDVLRSLRQRHPSLRMVLTGSIGLHHVLSALKKKNYANSPINDMELCEIAPLDPGDGANLAHLLLEGEGVLGEDIPRAAASLSASVDHFPYYIHHLVRSLKRKSRQATAATIDATLAELLADPNDPWQLRHYRDRLHTYYPDEEGVALLVLDAAATVESLGFDGALAAVKAGTSFQDKESLRSLLTLLQRDHYLRRAGDGFAFAYPLIKRWWRLDRDLHPLASP
jgi:hypothetical protein